MSITPVRQPANASPPKQTTSATPQIPPEAQEQIDLLRARIAQLEARRPEAPRVFASNPELTGRAEGYGQLEGELFAEGGPSLEDIDQGALADCYFLAAVGSLVAAKPAAITDMIRDNQDGTYSVRFYHQGEPVWIVVDGQLPLTESGALAYAGARDADGDGLPELWVAILEKGYAAFKDQYGEDNGRMGYTDLGGTGHSDTVFRAFTGGEPRRLSGLDSPEAFYSALSGANDGYLVTVTTHANSGQDGWIASHAYTVLGTYEQDGELMVILRNPWGRGEPDNAINLDPNNDHNDGVFAVPASELNRHDSRVYTTEPEGEARFSYHTGVRA